MTISSTIGKQKKRQEKPTKTTAKSNLSALLAGAVVFGILWNHAPPTAQAAAWSATQAIFKLADGGISNTVAKAKTRAKPKATPKVLAIPSANSIAGRGQRLLANHSVTTTAGAGCNPLPDLKSGQMFIQDVVYLEKLAAAGFKVRLSCIITGHSQDVAGTTRTSLHFVGKAFDVDRINGEPICNHMVGTGNNRVCTQPSPASKLLTRWLFAQPNSQLPFEVGGPFRPGSRSKSRGGPFFTNAGHQDHFHFGF